MQSVAKYHAKIDFGRAFPASDYGDPRGGRASALERNILRYRAAEAALYLFYAQEIRDFMFTNVHSAAIRRSGGASWELRDEQRLHSVLTDLLRDAEAVGKILPDDMAALRNALPSERQPGKKLKAAFAYAIKIGIFTEAEAIELKGLLDCRNDIAHRTHLVMSDVSRDQWAIDYFKYVTPTYKGEALDRLRAFRRSLWERASRQLTITMSMNGVLFKFAERVFEQDLKRLDRLITRQIGRERERYRQIDSELDLSGSELVNDLSPRFPANHRSGRQGHGDDYIPATGHLTKRGVEICYRLFDLGKSLTAVAYLMGMSLRSVERRHRGWIKSGGHNRVRAEIVRYDMHLMKPLPRD